MKTLHKNVRQQIKKRKTMYETKANKEYKHVVFQPGDWVEYICAMRDFHPRESPNYNHEEMSLFRSLKG